ncbi:DNA-binding SARP family transcriptional activator/tetratricopeptide (TPR) repeat protein [Kibdelosporangium banguiense]|uniref:DNA-binding SARP family transcriptional activator/tetratricopeptide (TPR) repeat protein n=1 Tax=Kibdelosporangium banguiense TaxID=1365924 RepID=A0ABS4U284_9PSEU|nr:tetratricopeptide repeat protein [Kibdelosporangium banguiense]MBP2330324.1 DNA-binding SARP family transcriptional activator/tetratricopeptide (TPR) repeat protein [Kibdelosporangium banguiense]
MRIQVLGSLRAWNDRVELDLGPPARRAVLGLLALAGGEAVPRRELMDALWGDRPPRSAVNVLQTHIKHLRRVLEPGRPPRSSSTVLPHVSGGYAVHRDIVDVDLVHVRRLIDEANDAHRDGNTARVATLLGEALRLWRGRPLADIPFLATHPKVVALVAERREVLARHGDAMIAIGAAADVLPEVAEAAADQPLDESVQARLIRVYHAVGQRAKAFQTYHEVRDRLIEELGIDPGPELLAAHAALLHDGETTGTATTKSRPAPRVPKQLPAVPHGFTGRTSQLSMLDDLLPEREKAMTIAAISGTAGVGKTALAVRWAHRVRDRFPDGQLYANLRGHAHGPPATPIEILAQFLSALDIPAERVPLDLETASALYRTLTTDQKTLVLLDNAASPDQIRPLLPSGPGCLVLVTGRDRMAGLVAMHGARQLTLDVLSPDDALDLLARILGAERVNAEHEAAVEFAKLCAYLPLALRIAAANLADRPGCGIQDYVAELREGNLLAALAVQGDEQTAVRTAFDLSYAALPSEAQRLFGLLSLLPGTEFSVETVAALIGADLGETGRLLDRLAGAHLVEHQAPSHYHFHDLLRRYAAEQVQQQEPQQDRDSALKRLYDWYLHAVDGAARLLYPHMLRLPVPEIDARMPSGVTEFGGAAAWLDAELGNLVTAIRAGPPAMTWPLADALRGYFWMCMRRVEWQAAAAAGLTAAEQTGDSRARAAARLSLADLHFRQGRYRQAVRHYTSALLLARQAEWVEAQAAVLGNLGCAYWQAGRLTAAAVRFDRGRVLSRSIGQPIGEAVALGNLGNVHWELGRLSQAAEHYAQALSRYRQIGSRYGEAINLGNLGQVQRVRGLPAEAAVLLTRAISLHREAGNRACEAETHSRLAATYCDLGRMTEAADYARTGLTLAEQSGEPRTEAEALATLAAVHHRLGHRQDAIRRYRQALELIRETGDRYPEIDILIGLTTATAEISHARHALALAEQAGYRALQGQAMTALAGVLLAQGRAADAAEHARRALAIHHETGHRLGATHSLGVLDRT